MEILVRRLGDIDRAYAEYYSRLAEHFAAELSLRKIRTILEAGCGKGQLTIPFLRKLPRSVRMIAVDSSRGPYEGWLDELPDKLAQSGFENRVEIMDLDVSRISRIMANVDAVISNELLCDLVPKTRLTGALKEFWKILRPGGTMVHGEWSSHIENERRSLLVKHRPSWTPDQLHSLMVRCGFGDFHVSYFESTINFKDEAAIAELRSWGASSKFLRTHERLLRKEGFRLPFEHIVRCRRGERTRSM